MSGSRSQFTPLPYQATQPWSIENQLVQGATANSPGGAYQMLHKYRNDREAGQEDYANYMMGVNELQARNLANNREDSRLQHLPGAIKGTAGHAGAAEILQRLMPETFGPAQAEFGKLIAGNDRASNVQAYKDTAAGNSSNSDAGVVPGAGQHIQGPDGLISEASGVSSRVESAEQGNPGRFATTVDQKFVPGTTGPSSTNVQTKSPGSGFSVPPNRAMTPANRQRANDIPLTQPQAAPPATTAPVTQVNAPASAEAGKAPAISKDMIMAWSSRLADKAVAADIAAGGGAQFKDNGDGTVTVQGAKTTHIIRIPKK